jgi:hypothetical protein
MRLLGHPEAHRHCIEELVLELDAEPLEILPDVKDQLIVAEMEMLALEQRPVRPPVGVGVSGQEVVAVVAMQHQQIEPQAGGRPAVHGIEDMGREARNPRHTDPFLLRSVDY